MAVKTFTTGEVLTAADTNTYLNNGGLVYITASTINGATVSVNSCFTSTYRNYRILWRIATSTGDPEIRFTLRASGSDSVLTYYTGAWLVDSAGTLNYSQNGAYSRWGIAYNAASNTCSGAMDVIGPQIAANTSFIGNSTNSTGTAARSVAIGGAHLTATAYDGFTLTASTGTMTGEVTIFGYRQA